MIATDRASSSVRLIILSACCAVAFAVPLWQLLGNFNQLQPDGIRLLIPFIAAAWCWLRLRGRPVDAAHGRIALYAGFATTALAALLYTIPTFVMRYWQFHWLLLPLFCAGGLAMLFGRKAVTHQWPVLVYLLLLWPPLIHAISAVMTPLLLNISESGAYMIIDFFKLPVHVTSDHLFTCQTPHGSAQLRIGSPCSGINGFLALSMCLIPLISEGRGGWINSIIIIIAGIVLLCILSIARLGILTAITCNAGIETGFEYFHLLGGPLFFLVLCCSVFLLSAALGLRIRLPKPSIVDARPLHTQLCTWYFCFALITSVSTALISFKPLLPQPPGVTHHYDVSALGHAVPQLPGSTSWHVREMDWTKPLFGDDSQFDRFACQRDGQIYWIDSLLVSNFDKLELHNVFDCYRWHNYSLLARDFQSRLLDLPARRYHYRDNNDREWLSITWLEHIDSNDSDWWQRFHVQMELSSDKKDQPAHIEAMQQQLLGLCEELLRARRDMSEQGDFTSAIK